MWFDAGLLVLAAYALVFGFLGTVGQPVPGATIRIGGDGEIQVKGPMVFPGYWHNDAATAEALDSDGWLRTGDLGTMDASRQRIVVILECVEKYTGKSSR